MDPVTVAKNDFDRGIMQFAVADNPIVVIVSSVVVLGGISWLVAWGLSHAYPT